MVLPPSLSNLLASIASIFLFSRIDKHDDQEVDEENLKIDYFIYSGVSHTVSTSANHYSSKSHDSALAQFHRGFSSFTENDISEPKL
jgi:hypothetical protein